MTASKLYCFQNMPVDVRKLSNLYTSGDFRSWLLNHNSGYVAYLDDIRDRIGVSILQSKLVDVYHELLESELADKLKDYINNRHPELLTDDGTKLSISARSILPYEVDDPYGVFSAYNPSLLRYPMQAMFFCDDLEDMQEVMNEFTGRYKDHESLILGEWGYIEYVPNDLDFTVYDKNWEIRKWKKSNQKYDKGYTDGIQSD